MKRSFLQNLETVFSAKLRWRYFAVTVPVLLVLIVGLLVVRNNRITASEAASKAAVSSSIQLKKNMAKKKAAASAAAAKKKQAAKPVNWRKPSQSKAYPSVSKHPHLELDVSIKKQHVYVKDGKKILYTMYASTGMDGTTPKGTFHIQSERGDYFYNPSEKMGAHYYTSFLDHGKYLFHTVPTDVNGKYITSEANKLGKEAASHGCVRLTIPDAKWINANIPVGTKVKID
ncbi:L,D-transpeptidase [Lacticaseibacillus songhuajiangensis]|uniref:L,D-transpeptidase n=1 Tax=Lacticaseibacillus songhuajiangensis TaxID=1296539 RepID=UPI000F796392|nr:L,D-transpeptidase [Lacticaseibacillus songhuajiangensis]